MVSYNVSESIEALADLLASYNPELASLVRFTYSGGKPWRIHVSKSSREWKLLERFLKLKLTRSKFEDYSAMALANAVTPV